MKVKYYYLSDHQTYGPLNDSDLDKKFISRELAVEYAKLNGKPSYGNSISFAYKSNLSIYKTEKYKESQIITSRLRRSRISKKIEVEKERVVLEKDYSRYQLDYNSWLKEARGYQNDKHPGYFESKATDWEFNVTQDGVISWSAPILARFVDARRIWSSEKKNLGVPYQPEKEEIVSNPISDWMPVYVSGEDCRYSSRVYHISSSGGTTWEMAQRALSTNVVYINMTEIDIIELL